MYKLNNAKLADLEKSSLNVRYLWNFSDFPWTKLGEIKRWKLIELDQICIKSFSKQLKKSVRSQAKVLGVSTIT